MSYDENHKTETYNSLIAISLESFKAMQYLNGGSLLAILTYLRSLKPASPDTRSLAKFPLTLFILGLVCGTFVYFTAYSTQYALHNENFNMSSYIGSRLHIWLHITFGFS